MHAADSEVDTWFARLVAGDRRALGRCITWVENQTAQGMAVLRAAREHPGVALVAGFTGSPGAGKSTLVSACIGEFRRRGRTVAVAAVDPSSPLTGGAILGDRIRMAAHNGDPGVFVRSIASRGQVGGLSLTTSRIVDVLAAGGYDVVIVETVGAGQSECEIAGLADTKVVMTTPGYGDEMQVAKAGILEIADVLVVNKSDMPGAERTAAQLTEMVSLGSREGWQPPVLCTVATTGEGVAALIDAIEAHADAARAMPAARALECTRRLLATLAADEVRRRVGGDNSPAVDDICERVGRGEISFDVAIDILIGLAAGGN
ncbi:MAG: methylmalonyl Co-A mutase-associated GTPase MeaB [Gammaproteobacteria bacterium]|nr:methylmalonyl Co-A mutase-associated GTPase MeaB [Gammaproteobacteria bacterium]